MKSKQAAVQFIFVTILLDAIGLGIIIPVLPDIIRRFGSEPEFVNRYFGFFISAYAFMQFVSSPVLGAISDRFGRRPILLTSLLGAALDYTMMAFAPNLTILFIGRIIAGLTGASMTVAASYMADVSDDKNRSANFGLIGAAWGVGFILGPLLGGLVGNYGAQYPFLFAATLNMINLLWGLFVLPESLPKDKRRHVALKKLNPLKSLYKVFVHSPVKKLIAVYGIIFLAGQSHPSIWTLYTQHKFHWTSFEVGLSLAFVGITIALAQGGLTRVIIPKIGEHRSVLIGLAFYILGFGAFAFASQGWMMYAFMALFSFSGITAPALQSEIAKHTPADEQGELQGSLMSLGSLTAIVGPLVYTSAFAMFTGPQAFFDFPGIAYFLASVFSLLALGLAVVF